MIPRKLWWGPKVLYALNRACHNANREIKKGLDGRLGINLPHSRIGAESPSMYQDDRVHLSVAGVAIFPRDLQQGLQEALDLQVTARA